MRSLYGYIRVSTREQNEDRQIIALRELSIPEEHLYVDKQSGKDFVRCHCPRSAIETDLRKRWVNVRIARRARRGRGNRKNPNFFENVPQCPDRMW